jgi:hypothetical protein
VPIPAALPFANSELRNRKLKPWQNKRSAFAQGKYCRRVENWPHSAGAE